MVFIIFIDLGIHPCARFVIFVILIILMKTKFVFIIFAVARSWG